jgi:uncharacterized protein (TIGR03435 family)
MIDRFSSQYAPFLRLARTSLRRCGLGLFCACLCAQSSKDLIFEAASVKPVPTLTAARIRMEGGPGTSDPTRITYANVPLKQLFVVAYGVKQDQVSGPDWLDSDNIDISAKIAPGASRADFHMMLQNLLIERFGVVIHREQKGVSMYQLVVAKDGPKAGLRPSKRTHEDEQPNNAGGPAGNARLWSPIRVTRRMNGECRLVADGISLAQLAGFLQGRIGKRVSDATNLGGPYEFELQWSEDSPVAMPLALPNGTGPGPETSIETASGPTLFRALQEQLGLKLEAAGNTSIDMVVIDHMNRLPTPN